MLNNNQYSMVIIEDLLWIIIYSKIWYTITKN